MMDPIDVAGGDAVLTALQHAHTPLLAVIRAEMRSVRSWRAVRKHHGPRAEAARL
jgi:hypothetical protein